MIFDDQKETTEYVVREKGTRVLVDHRTVSQQVFWYFLSLCTYSGPTSNGSNDFFIFWTIPVPIKHRPHKILRNFSTKKIYFIKTKQVNYEFMKSFIQGLSVMKIDGQNKCYLMKDDYGDTNAKIRHRLRQVEYHLNCYPIK